MTTRRARLLAALFSLAQTVYATEPGAPSAPPPAPGPVTAPAPGPLPPPGSLPPPLPPIPGGGRVPTPTPFPGGPLPLPRPFPGGYGGMGPDFAGISMVITAAVDGVERLTTLGFRIAKENRGNITINVPPISVAPAGMQAQNLICDARRANRRYPEGRTQSFKVCRDGSCQNWLGQPLEIADYYFVWDYGCWDRTSQSQAQGGYIRNLIAVINAHARWMEDVTIDLRAQAGEVLLDGRTVAVAVMTMHSDRVRLGRDNLEDAFAFRGDGDVQSFSLDWSTSRRTRRASLGESLAAAEGRVNSAIPAGLSTLTAGDRARPGCALGDYSCVSLVP